MTRGILTIAGPRLRVFGVPRRCEIVDGFRRLSYVDDSFTSDLTYHDRDVDIVVDLPILESTIAADNVSRSGQRLVARHHISLAQPGTNGAERASALQAVLQASQDCSSTPH